MTDTSLAIGGQSLVEPPRLELVGEQAPGTSGACRRGEAQAIFLRYLQASPPQKRILFIYGEAGHGKSQLMHQLQQECCPPVPAVGLDFGAPTRSLKDLRNPVTALATLRRQLAALGVACPLFDYGLLLWLHKSRHLDLPHLRELLGGQVPLPSPHRLASLAGLASPAAAPRLLGLALNLAAGRDADDQGPDPRTVRYLDEAKAMRLAQVEGVGELPLQLPKLLARDLNATLRDPNSGLTRLVLFFDSHNAFWGHADETGTGPAERLESPAAYHARDEWLRVLLNELDLGAGLMVVVAGRQKPRWTEAPPRSAIPAARLDMQLLGQFDLGEARRYLQDAGLSDPLALGRLLDLAQVDAGQYHPMCLGLGADLFRARRAAQQQAAAPAVEELRGLIAGDPEAVCGELLRLLLASSNEPTARAIAWLGAARTFDWSLYLDLARELGLPASLEVFERVCHLSFVSPVSLTSSEASDAAPRYRVHGGFRRLLELAGVSSLPSVDLALAILFERRVADGQIFAGLEALYHRAQLDAPAAARSWQEQFGLALDLAQHRLCQGLISLMDDVHFEDDLASAKAYRRAGSYWVGLGRWEAAEGCFSFAEQYAQAALASCHDDPQEHARCLNVLGLTWHGLACMWAELGHFKEAQALWEQAIAQCEQACAQRPDRAAQWANLGSAREGLAGLLAHQSRGREAEALYLRAIADLEHARSLQPEHLSVLNNLAAAQHGLGEWLAACSRHAEAAIRFRQAIESLGQVLRTSPEDPGLLHNLGLAQHALGDLLSTLSQFDEAEAALRHAMASFERVLQRAPDSLPALTGLAQVARGLADVYAQRALPQQALWLYRRAQASFLQVFALAPAHAPSWSALGAVEQGLAGLPAECLAPETPEALLRLAVGHQQRACELAPAEAKYFNALGLALMALADLHESQGLEQAPAEFEQAAQAIERALVQDAHLVPALNNLALAHLRCAKLLASASRPQEAEPLYLRARHSLEQALALAPGHVAAWDTLGHVHQGLAMCLAALHRHHEAQARCRQAVVCFERALVLAPGDAVAWDNLGGAQQVLAGMLVTHEASHREAAGLYQSAIESYGHVQVLQPPSPALWNNLGMAKKGLGLLHARRGQHDKAEPLLRQAAADLARARDAWLDRAQAQYALVSVLLSLAQVINALNRVTELGYLLDEIRVELARLAQLAPEHPSLKQLELSWGRLIPPGQASGAP